jgi:hypothetical protein
MLLSIQGFHAQVGKRLANKDERKGKGKGERTKVKARRKTTGSPGFPL